MRLFARLFSAFDALRERKDGAKEFERACLAASQSYEESLLFESETRIARAVAYERVISTLINSINVSYGTSLPQRCARVLASVLCVQLWPSSILSVWKAKRFQDANRLFSTLEKLSNTTKSVEQRLVDGISNVLGLQLDVFSKILLWLCIRSHIAAWGTRSTVGVILSHGYSTATSIADTANRILRAHVFEAIDMPYEMHSGDVLASLREIVEKYSCCKEIAILVDMGSLEELHTGLSYLSNARIAVANNVSTGLAVEIGTRILAGQELKSCFSESVDCCEIRYKFVEPRKAEEAILFVSENGEETAERLLSLIASSLPIEIPVRFCTCDYLELAQVGGDHPIFSRYVIKAIIGTKNPEIASLPYIPVEDLISGVCPAALSSLFGRYLDSDMLAEFLHSILKNMTIQNVIKSITILNPERLFSEVESAVAQLCRKLGQAVESNIEMGLYVHLCCLVERLVTRTPIENYADIEEFERDHRDFVLAFESSFSDISLHYHVSVPLSEIAYVFDYLDMRIHASDDSLVSNPEDE